MLVQPGSVMDSGEKTTKTEQPVLPVEKKVEYPSAIRFLGENKQQVTIVVHSQAHPFLPDSELELLTKMIGACNLHLDDIALINEYNSIAQWQEVHQQLAPRIILFFGSKIWQQQLPFAIPFYQVQPHGSQLYLIAPALESLLDNTDAVKSEKLKLWTALQKIFKKK